MPQNSSRNRRRLAAAGTAGVITVAAAVVVGAPANGAPDPDTLVAAHPAAAPKFHPGSQGLGDPYFPKLGNGGYDVKHYGLDLRYRPKTHLLSGTAAITAEATTNLSRFDLDLKGMHVSAVTVGGAAATYEHTGGELIITPQSGLRKGKPFHVSVTYSGKPKTITGSPIVFGADYGWQYTKDGAFVGDEPNGAHTWFPCNDHPSDKATFSFTVTVPKGKQVVSNGDLVAEGDGPGTDVFVWKETKPEATYLATIDIGHWDFVRGKTPNGIPELMAVDPKLANRAKKLHDFRLTGRITDFWAKRFGKYAFTSTGAIIDDVPNVGFSLETQTRPLYGFAPDVGTMAHELSHQWFGDSVSVATWKNIWLNEGFATFAATYWFEHTGKVPSTYAAFKSSYDQIGASNKFWHQSIADPKRPTMFSGAVYQRGGMTLAALRHRIGSHDFFTLLRTWTRTHRHGNGTTAEFTALAHKVSGQKLHRFFHVWLWAKKKPASFDAG